MAYDYSKLRGRIIEKFGTQAALGEALGISEATICAKLRNRAGWKQAEIVEACRLLDIPDKEIGAYFFAADVQRC